MISNIVKDLELSVLESPGQWYEPLRIPGTSYAGHESGPVSSAADGQQEVSETSIDTNLRTSKIAAVADLG